MEQFRCTRCGQIHNVTPVKSQALSKLAWRAQMAFAMRGEDAASLKVIPQERYIQPTTVLPGARVETPVAQQNMESNVKVPLAQALITGGIIGCATFCIAVSVVTGAEIFFNIPKPVLFVIIPTTIATLRAVYSQWKGGVNMADSLLTKIEDFTGVDWNRDGQTGSQPAPAPQIERGLMVHGKDGLSKLLLPDLPRHQIERMARKSAIAFLAAKVPKEELRRNFTRRYLGQPWGDRLAEVQATLLELGLVEYVGNDTHELTGLGADWLTEVLENA